MEKRPRHTKATQGNFGESHPDNTTGDSRWADGVYSPQPKHALGPVEAKDLPQESASQRRFPLGCTLLALLVCAVISVFAWGANALSELFPAGYQSPYTWENLTWSSDGRPSYFEDDQLTSKLGIDVSAYDNDIDWQAVANDGIEFAIIRAAWRGYTEGGLNEDEYFRTNITEAKAAGLQVGVYVFSSAITEDEAREEAQFVLDLIGQTGVALDLPIVFDHEPVSSSNGRANNLDIATASAIANAFCEEIEAAGHVAMLYGNQSDMARFNDSVTENRPVWLAEYETSLPTAEFDFTIWQFTSTGTVAGIDRNVDMDIWFSTVVPLP